MQLHVLSKRIWRCRRPLRRLVLRGPQGVPKRKRENANVVAYGELMRGGVLLFDMGPQPGWKAAQPQQEADW